MATASADLPNAPLAQSQQSAPQSTAVKEEENARERLAGQGSGLAMLGAYVLAGEIHRAGGDYAAAFRRYEERLGAFLRKKQKSALYFAGTFAPKSKFWLFVRNQVMNLKKIPWVTELAVSRDLVDKITVPDYL